VDLFQGSEICTKPPILRFIKELSSDRLQYPPENPNNRKIIAMGVQVTLGDEKDLLVATLDGRIVATRDPKDLGFQFNLPRFLGGAPRKDYIE
jgi:hypothetical protein